MQICYKWIRRGQLQAQCRESECLSWACWDCVTSPFWIYRKKDRMVRLHKNVEAAIEKIEKFVHLKSDVIKSQIQQLGEPNSQRETLR